jgi:hypothetical protein
LLRVAERCSAETSALDHVCHQVVTPAQRQSLHDDAEIPVLVYTAMENCLWPPEAWQVCEDEGRDEQGGSNGMLIIGQRWLGHASPSEPVGDGQGPQAFIGTAA